MASRYAESHPGTLRLDPVELRDLISQAPSDDSAAVPFLPAIRDITLAAAGAYLAHGHDVIVPQLVADPAQLDRFFEVAERVGAQFWSFVLLDDQEVLVERVRARQATGYRPVVTPMEIAEYRDKLIALAAAKNLPVIQHERLSNPDELHDLLEGPQVKGAQGTLAS